MTWDVEGGAPPPHGSQMSPPSQEVWWGLAHRRGSSPSQVAILGQLQGAWEERETPFSTRSFPLPRGYSGKEGCEDWSGVRGQHWPGFPHSISPTRCLLVFPSHRHAGLRMSDLPRASKDTERETPSPRPPRLLWLGLTNGRGRPHLMAARWFCGRKSETRHVAAPRGPHGPTLMPGVKATPTADAWGSHPGSWGRWWPRKSQVKEQKDPAALSPSGPYSLVPVDLVPGAAHLSPGLFPQEGCIPAEQVEGSLGHTESLLLLPGQARLLRGRAWRESG